MTFAFGAACGRAMNRGDLRRHHTFHNLSQTYQNLISERLYTMKLISAVVISTRKDSDYKANLMQITGAILTCTLLGSLYRGIAAFKRKTQLSIAIGAEH